MLCWAELHWAVEQFTLEWPEVGINPLIPLPSPLFLSSPDPGANQQLFVHCHLTNDFSGKERKTAWGVSEVQRAGVTASEKRGGWRVEEVEEKGREWERTRVNPSPRDITNPSCHFSLLSVLLLFLHSCSTPYMDIEMTAVVFLFAGQWSCSGCHRSLWLDVCEECLCMALHVHWATLPLPVYTEWSLLSGLYFLCLLKGLLQRFVQRKNETKMGEGIVNTLLIWKCK